MHSLGSPASFHTIQSGTEIRALLMYNAAIPILAFMVDSPIGFLVFPKEKLNLSFFILEFI
jgi:hypothetical protein